MPLRACVAAVLAGFALAAHAQPKAGDKDNGRLLLRQFGCGGCHEIPGVADAAGKTGPSLKHFAKRIYIAGIAPNEVENLVRFIRDPKSLDPRTKMPDLGVGEAHARDMAAYLGSVK